MRFRQVSVLGGASIALQLSSYLFLLWLKSNVTATGFVDFVSFIALSGIFGSILTFRSEVVVVQQEKALTLRTVIVPLSLAISFLVVISVVDYLLVVLGVLSTQLNFSIYIMAFGVGLLGLSDFIAIRIGLNWLVLLNKVIISVCLVGIALLYSTEFINSVSSIKTLYFSSYVGSTMCCLVGMVLFSRSSFTSRSAGKIDLRSMASRGSLLSVNTLVNSLFVSCPLLLAAAVLPAGVSADFALLQRTLTGPTTFIRQSYGQLFLKRLLEWDNSGDLLRNKVQALTQRTMKQAGKVYVILVTPLVVIVGILSGYLEVENFNLVFFLIPAFLAQSVVNPLSQIRIVLNQEKQFLLFDIARVTTLLLVLFLVPPSLFVAAFGLTVCLTYLVYVRFILNRVQQISAG